jgi:D-alanyl-D-alanine carboxypeptidase
MVLATAAIIALAPDAWLERRLVTAEDGAAPPALVAREHAAPLAPVPEGPVVPVEAAAQPAPASAAHAAREPVPAPWAHAPSMLAGAPLPPYTTASAALLMDEASGAVLYHHNGHTKLPPASLTKIATAIVAIERGNLDEWVTSYVDSRTMRGSTVMGLIPGDQFTLRDLLYGLMLPSGNDAALAIGRHVSGSDAAFVAEMNALVQRLGLRDSYFANPHGLSGSGHGASAYDLAMLSRYAMTLPDFRVIVAAPSWTANGSRRIPMFNLMNGVLYGVPGADGVKSGYTRSAGRTMVASATRDGQRLYAVVMNDAAREADVYALLQWGFTAFEWSDVSVALSQESGAAAPAPAS